MKSLLFPILSIIAAVGLYFFFISPNLEEISSLKVKDAEFAKSLQDVREIENIMARLESSYAGINREDLIRLERFLPRELDNTQTIRDLSALVEEEGALLESIDFSGTYKKAPSGGGKIEPEENGVRLSFYARYDVFKDVLESIESDLHIAQISSIAIGSQSDRGDAGNLGLTKYDIGLVYYSYSTEE